jgi:uncharacterized protein (DUF58 family)
VTTSRAAGNRGVVGQHWRPTRALGRAVLLTGLLVLGGVLLGRVDVVLLATPFALGVAWALRRRPQTLPDVEVTADRTALSEGEEVTGTISAVNADRTGYDALVLRAAMAPWVNAPAIRLPQVLAVPPGEAVDLAVSGTALRWGRHRLGPVNVTALACDGLLIARCLCSATVDYAVYPITEPFDATETVPRAAGLVGQHRSRRPGEGGELAGVRQFAPGDRLRRVDWRVSLRTRQLHVAATLSDRDAEVVLVLDVLADAGHGEGPARGTTVLDTTVRAAAATAEHYLHHGDRVAMVEYSRAARRLRPASGRRQYLTVLEWLLDTSAGGSAGAAYDQVLGPHLLSANALTVVLTPLIDPSAAAMLAQLTRAGRFVLAVDTLPPDVVPPDLGAHTEVAYRLWRLERENTIGALREHGVPVVPWAGTGSLDLVLRDLSRSASAPRAGVR